jgi:hypothetical protein
LVPQVKQIRSSWLTAAPQPGQVSVAMASSRTARPVCRVV